MPYQAVKPARPSGPSAVETGATPDLSLCAGRSRRRSRSPASRPRINVADREVVAPSASTMPTVGPPTGSPISSAGHLDLAVAHQLRWYGSTCTGCSQTALRRPAAPATLLPRVEVVEACMLLGRAARVNCRRSTSSWVPCPSICWIALPWSERRHDLAAPGFAAREIASRTRCRETAVSKSGALAPRRSEVDPHRDGQHLLRLRRDRGRVSYIRAGASGAEQVRVRDGTRSRDRLHGEAPRTPLCAGCPRCPVSPIPSGPDG